MVNMESVMRSRELTETRMIQALREEFASAERRAEDERAAHNATKMAAMEREAELEHRAVDTSTALARIQAWQEEVEPPHQGQREAESKLSSLEAEVQKMRIEMAAMKRDAENYSHLEHMELEKRYHELTDLLYYKQTQLGTMASEKAAAEFQLEKEIKRLQEAQIEAERSRVSRGASPSWEEVTEMKALEPLPLHHRHMAAASIQLQKAAKLLDTGAVRAIRFLWRYPTARVILLFYLEQADNISAREDAAAMGLP